MKSLIAAFVFCVASVAVCIGQTGEAKSINGGILNGKAISLPKPEYPEQAKLAGIGGAIGVLVEVDESGAVTSAVADINDQRTRFDANGEKQAPLPADPYLREAAEKAALQARFSPTLLSGKPVKVKGRILYNFVSDKSDKGTRVGDIYGPLLNSQATSLPAPTYPDVAKAVNAGGEVTIHVAIDTEGNVTSAKATSGHPLLRAAAEKAAMEAKFRPSPMPSAGVLLYRFVP